MKKILRFFAVCTLVGAPFLYTGCTDFSEDINAVNERIDKLVSGDVATIQQQISNLQSTVTALEAAKTDAAKAIETLQGQTSALESSVSSLQSTVSDLEKNLATLKTELDAIDTRLANNESLTNDLKQQLVDARVELLGKIAEVQSSLDNAKGELNLAIQAIQYDLSALTGRVDGIDVVIASMSEHITALENNKADISWVEATFATKDELAEANRLIAELRADLTAVENRMIIAEGKIASVENRLNEIDTYHQQIDSRLASLDAAVQGLGVSLGQAFQSIANNTELINGLREDLAAAKQACLDAVADLEATVMTELDKVRNIANSALDMATSNAGEISSIKAALDNIYRMEEIDAMITNLSNILSSQIEAEKTALENYKKATDALIAGLQDDYRDLEGRCDLIDGKVDEINASLAAVESRLDLKIQTVANDVAALEASLNSLSERVDGIEEDIESLEAALNGRINTLESDYQAADLALQTAISNVEGKVDALQLAFNTVVSGINGKIDNLTSRIQSIAYVPEYADGAYAQTVKLNDNVISEMTVVTFKVTPSKYVKDVNENTATLLATPQLKSATYDDKGIYDFEYDEAKGLVTIRTAANYDGKAIAISVLKGDATGSNLTSEFVQVKERPVVELSDKYVLYDSVNDKEFGSYSETFGWDVWFATKSVPPFAGYEPYIKYEDEYYTIAEAADLFLVADVNTITPVAQTPKSTWTPSNNSKVRDALAVTGKDATEIKIAKKDGVFAKAEDLIPCVNGDVTVKTYYKLGTKEVTSLSYTAYCKIVYRQITWELEEDTNPIAWTYDLAVAQSSAKAAANYLDQPYEYKEIDFKPDQIYDYSEYENVLKNLTKKLYISVDGADEVEYTGTEQMTVAYRAGINHKIADVTLDGGLYEFGNGKEIRKVFNNKYTDNTNATDYNVKFATTFGPKPTSKTVNLNDGGFYDMTFSSKGYITKDLADAPMSALFGQIEPNTFKDKATFDAAVYFNEQVPSGYVYNIVNGREIKVKDVTPDWTYINVSAGSKFVEGKKVSDREGQGLRVSTNADMENKDNKFSFTTEYQTWWGPKYTFNAKAQIVLPDYSLVTVEQWVDAENNVQVPGHTEGTGYTQKWVINDAKLNTYVKVVGTDASDKLQVIYEVIKPQDAASKGIANFPAAPAASDVKLADNSINEAVLSWGYYTATELDVKVSLVIIDETGTKPIELDSVTLHLYTNKMVEVADSEEVTVERAGQPEVFGNAWEGLRIYGKDTATDVDVDSEGEKVNFAWVSSDKTEGRFRYAAASKYGLGCTFELVKIEGAETDLTNTFSKDNYDFDATTGIVTLKSNEATLRYDITFTVRATVTFDRDYEHKQAETSDVKITFKVPANN